MTYDVELWVLRNASDEQLADLHVCEEILRREAEPDEPGRTVEEFIAMVRATPATYEVTDLVVRDETGGVCAWADTVIVEGADNTHVIQCAINVRADARRQGIGRALLDAVVGFARERGRTLIIGTTDDRLPAGERFAEGIGASRARTSRMRRLELSRVDASMIDRWIADGPVRAPDYALEMVDGSYPDHLIEQVPSVLFAMNDEPRGDLEIEDRRVTVDLLREIDASYVANGFKRWTVFARHVASGELAGLTEVLWDAKQPQRLRQGDTAVLKQHRGYALGKWLKATMLRRVLDELPDATEVRTNNAETNDAMVGINELLGFVPLYAITTWQHSIDR